MPDDNLRGLPAQRAAPQECLTQEHIHQSATHGGARAKVHRPPSAQDVFGGQQSVAQVTNVSVRYRYNRSMAWLLSPSGFLRRGSRMTPEPPPSINTFNRPRLTEPDVRVDTVGNVRTPLPVRSNRPIKKRGEMDRWEEESVQTTHKEKR